MPNPRQRIAQIRHEHQLRLKKVLLLLTEGLSAYQLALHLYGKIRGWNIFLALAETCAHLDFLLDNQLIDETRDETGTKIFFRTATAKLLHF